MRFVLAFSFFMGLAFSSVSCVSTNIVAMAEKDNLRGVKNALEKGTQIDMQNRVLSQSFILEAKTNNRV